MTKLKELKARFMKDPEFREEYARVDEEYALIEALEPVRRQRRGLSASDHPSEEASSGAPDESALGVGN